MVCPVCNTEAARTNSTFGYTVDGDKVKVYMVSKFYCRNRQCEQFEKEIGEDKQEIDAEPIA